LIWINGEDLRSPNDFARAAKGTEESDLYALRRPGIYRRTDETTIHELIEAAAQAPGWADAG